jgi:hypothetical protein
MIHLQDHTRQSLGYVSDKFFNSMATFGVKHTDDECPIFLFYFFVDIHHVSKTGSSDNMVLFYLYVDVINSILNHSYIELFQYFV